MSVGSKLLGADPANATSSRLGVLIDDALSDMRERNLKTLGIGVSLPGLIDRDNGVLLYAPNLAWANVPLVDSWSSKFPKYGAKYGTGLVRISASFALAAYATGATARID